MSSSTRLYVASVPRDAAELSLDGDRAHYLSRVLRLGAGAPLVLFDGSGAEVDGVVRSVSRQAVVVALGARRERNLESPLAIHLVQGISRAERMDFVVQKATELGVRRITPVLTERSVVRYDAERAAKRLRHWRGVAASACEQCGRNRLPDIDSPLAFLHWIERPAAASDLRLLLDPRAPRLAAAGPAPRAVQLLIGPEGGLAEGEQAAAAAAGFAGCALGPRVLRTETAAIAALAVLQAHWGDM